MEPTKEQEKSFWEQCGFKWRDYRCSFGNLPETKEGWFYPDGTFHTESPPTDLNNLFKYAVPKLDYAELNYDYRQSQEEGYKITHSDFVYTAVAVLDVAAEHRSTCEDKDPALALFWAIYKAFGGKEVPK